MKRIIILAAAFLLLAFSANAQMVGSTNNANANYGRYNSGTRSGWSYGLSAVGSLGFKADTWGTYKNSAGIWAEGGYNVTSQFYMGAALGVQVRKELGSYWDGYEYATQYYKHTAPRLLFGARYYFSPQPNSMFVDGRFGVQIDDPFDEYGRTELGVGFAFGNGFEVAAGLENEMWDALDGFGEFVRTKGFFVRVGYRFK